MGIDRHEWEHRNYKSGRAVAAPAQLADDDAGQLAVDASLGDAPLQPETSRPASKADTSKAKAKAAPKESSKGSSKPAGKTDAKAKSGAESGVKRSARR